MEIEFSPSQMAGAAAAGPAKARPAATSTSDPPQLQGMAELQRKLNDLALTRPDKMAAAGRALVEVKYPPEELLNGIAHLLAIQLKQ
jgi:hypothetical protein